MSVVYEKIVAEDLELGTGSITLTSPSGGTMVGTKINLATFTDSANTSDCVYLGGSQTEGAWRLIMSGNNLSIDRLESGTWVTKGVFIP
jgi:hypothetical protein